MAAGVLVVAAAVGGGLLLRSDGGDDDGADVAGSSRREAALAVLEVIDERIQVRTGEGEVFRPGATGDGLGVGDQVRSDETGFGELGYFDGSWMRIEAAATLTVDALEDVEGANVVETSIDGGRLWARAETLTGSGGRFEVDTPVGVASVRGTRFSIDCTVSWADATAAAAVGAPAPASAGEPEPDDACAFTVIDGIVLVEMVGGEEVELTAAQRLVVPSDGRPAVGPIQLVPDELYEDPWVAKNLGVDRAKPEAAELLGDERDGSGAAAALASEWKADVTVVSSTDPRFPVGGTGVGTWSIEVRCTAPQACRSERLLVEEGVGPALRDGSGNPVLDRITAVGPGRYEFVAQWTDTCERDGTVLARGGVLMRKQGTYEVTETEFRDGRWVATELRGTVVTTTDLSPAGETAGCELPERAASVSFTTEVVARA